LVVGNNASKNARGYLGGGYNDWYLSDIQELSLYIIILDQAQLRR